METLLPLLTIILAEGYKWGVKKFGVEHTKLTIYLGVFILSGVWTYMQNPDIFSGDFAKQLFVYASASIATYDILVKWIMKQPIFIKK